MHAHAARARWALCVHGRIDVHGSRMPGMCGSALGALGALGAVYALCAAMVAYAHLNSRHARNCGMRPCAWYGLTRRGGCVHSMWAVCRAHEDAQLVSGPGMRILRMRHAGSSAEH